MGHHINADGQFQSDKFPDLPPDKIVLSFNDSSAKSALHLFASLTDDKELADDILLCLSDFAKWTQHERDVRTEYLEILARYDDFSA